MRLTPLQFSVSVSFVVLLLAGAAIAGYLYGIKKAAVSDQQQALTNVPLVPVPSGEESAQSQTPAPVTFYTVLTETKEAVSKPPQQPESADEQPEEKPADTRNSGNLSLFLQVASYRARDSAGKLLESLVSEGYAGTIQVADLGERGIWYRVQIGPYGDESEAKGVLEKLRRERDLKGYIVR